MLMDGPIWRLRAPRRRYTKPRHVRLPVEEQQTVKGGGAGRVPGPGGAAAPGAAGRGGRGVRAGAPRPQVHLPHLPGDPRVPAPFLPLRRPPTLPGGGAADALIGSGGSGRREQWPPPPVKRERRLGPGTGTRVTGLRAGPAAAGTTRVPKPPRAGNELGTLRASRAEHGGGTQPVRCPCTTPKCPAGSW